MTPAARLDHLVVAAASLDQGTAWCEATFGIVPGPGGRHAFMGTHNRVCRLGSGAQRAYLEIISVDPAGTAPAHARWFDLDDPVLRGAIANRPRLVHFVVRCDDAASAVRALRARAADPGDLASAERATAHGMLRWQITIRADGRRQFGGALPALIEWSGPHPSEAMQTSGVRLRSFDVHLPRARELQAAYDAIGLTDVGLHEGTSDLVAAFDSPRGIVVLHSGGV